MVSRRKQTTLPSEQPVRFYKFIALTFLFLTIGLLTVVVLMSSKRATINIMTKPSPVDVTADVQVGADKNSADIAGVVATTTVQLERSYQPTGSRNEPGIATGVVTMHNDSGVSQPLVATTRLLTADGALFRIKSSVTVPAKGTVENVEVYADEEGEKGSIGPSRFTVPGLNEEKQKVIYATSDTPMSGGVKTIGILSDADVERAKKEFQAAVVQEGQKALQDQHKDYDAVFSSSEVQVEVEGEVGKETSGFTLRGTGTVVGVFYKKEDVRTWADTQLEKRVISDAEIVRAGGGEPSVSFLEYQPDKHTATLRVFADGVVVLSSESKQIEKSIFFGKTKDEVRRYLLSLDHVQTVDIKFSPAWIQTVPHIHDHVTVVVKEVE